jgi:ATP-dependent helicase/nuclease subunit B
VLAGVAEARRRAYRHAGRFSLAALPQLDRLAASGGSGQFSYALRQTGEPDRRFADLLTAGDFEALLDGVERRLIAMGQRIFAGEAAVDPYRRGGQPACAHCDYRSICRIDPWTHRYRVLKPGAAPD